MSKGRRGGSEMEGIRTEGDEESSLLSEDSSLSSLPGGDGPTRKLALRGEGVLHAVCVCVL